MTASNALGLTPTGMCTHDSTSTLQSIFGLTQPPVSDYLSFFTCILIVVLQQIDDALIKLPTDKEVHHYQEVLVHRHPELDGV